MAAGAEPDSVASEATELLLFCDGPSVATSASVTGWTLEWRRYHFECLARKGSINGSSKWEPFLDGRSTGRSVRNGAAAIVIFVCDEGGVLGCVFYVAGGKEIKDGFVLELLS